AALGATFAFAMLRRLVSSRAGWLGLVGILATPFFTLVARQAITDIPMVACVMAALSCFALAVTSPGDRSPPKIWRRLDAGHLIHGALALAIGGQGFYYLIYFHQHPTLGPGMRVWQPGILVGGGTILGLLLLLAVDRWLVPVRTMRQVFMRWAYLFAALSVLAKGPVGPAVIGTTCLAYLLVIEGEGRVVIDGGRRLWARLRGVARPSRRRPASWTGRLSLLQGLLITVLV